MSESTARSQREERGQGVKMRARMPSADAWSSSAGQEGVLRDFEA